MEHKCGKFSVLGFGLALGILAALYVLLMGLSAWLLNYGAPMVTLMGTVYLGYKATLIGSLIGAAWSFVDGFIAGAIFALIYNRFVRRCCVNSCNVREVPVVPVTPVTQVEPPPPQVGTQL